MKNLFLLLLLSFQFSTQAQSIEPAPDDKAVVYFVRPSATGIIINFTYYDGDRLIGRFNAPKYMRYECEPGEHLFWAKSENRSFIKAELEAGKIYVIEAMATMGAMKAGVRLEPVNSPDYRRLKQIKKLLSKKPPEILTEERQQRLQSQYSNYIEKGLKKAAKIDSKLKILKGQSFLPEELIYAKTRKN